MKFSTRTRYGLRFLVYLAVHYGEGAIQLKEAADNEEISIKYLEQIVRLLKPTTILGVQRGVHGGYFLTRQPGAIKLAEIFTYLEGDLNPVDCVSEAREIGEYSCPRKASCVTTEVWSGLKTVIVDYLNGISLEDLALKYSQSNKLVNFDI